MRAEAATLLIRIVASRHRWARSSQAQQRSMDLLALAAKRRDVLDSPFPPFGVWPKRSLKATFGSNNPEYILSDFFSNFFESLTRNRRTLELRNCGIVMFFPSHPVPLTIFRKIIRKNP
jgi:hypothetical protein